VRVVFYVSFIYALLFLNQNTVSCRKGDRNESINEKNLTYCDKLEMTG